MIFLSSLRQINMKTIKQLEKEIEWVSNTQNIQHTLEYDNWKIWHDRTLKLKETKAQLQTLKDVLKEIDKIIEDMHTNETPEELQHIAYTQMILENKLKAKLVGE